MSDVSAFQRPASETVERIARSVWLPLNRAPELVAKYLPAVSSEAATRKLLNAALASGDVRARIHGDFGCRALNGHHNFSLHVCDGTICIEQAPGETFACDVHLDDLERFIVGRQVPVQPAKANKVHEATVWLVARINAGEMHTNEIMYEKVKVMFGVSLRQYRDAKKAAVKITGRSDLTDRGRRPRAQIET